MIFVDTSFWIATRNRTDDHHELAGRLLAGYAKVPLVTSNQVRGETWTLLNKRAGHRSATAFLDALSASARLDLHFVDAYTEDEALAWLRRHDERSYSFVDATSFTLMRRLRITRAFAFDGDFTAAGFVELRAANFA